MARKSPYAIAVHDCNSAPDQQFYLANAGLSEGQRFFPRDVKMGG